MAEGYDVADYIPQFLVSSGRHTCILLGSIFEHFARLVVLVACLFLFLELGLGMWLTGQKAEFRCYGVTFEDLLLTFCSGTRLP
jgi:hypothetical protein